MSVLIISNSSDSTVNQVIDWLEFFECNFRRQNIDEIFQENKLTKEITNQNYISFARDFKSFWFRNAPIYFVKNRNKKSLLNNINSFIDFELFSICSAFFNGDKNKYFLSRYDTKILNKIHVLSMANEFNILVPDSIVTNDKDDLLKFSYIHSNLITKSIGENISFSYKEKYFAQYVAMIDNQNINDLPNKFLPTFFQRKIEKEFDIRIFFIEDKWFSIAVFSESLDMREDYTNHRYIPMTLPENILKKLVKLVKKLNLNTGSIDMIKEKNTSLYYFLEVNPNGQIGIFSKFCNVPLEKMIAQKLAKP
jgi:hypothetical protein